MSARNIWIDKQLGNYHIERLLAQGGFGDVYLGEHIHLGTQAAIKVLNAQIIQEDISQFRTEARTIARLIHPNIVRTLEFGVEGNVPFLVIDYAPNGTLRQRHPKGSQIPLSSVVTYVKQVADALQHAHEQKIIHRDIKPENMLIGRQNEILLSDFGIALIAQSSRYHGTWDMAGTIGYMAPEQIQARPTLASDQYALGVVVYEWLCGERPFHGSFTEIAVKHSTATPPSLCQQLSTLPSEVEEVVMTALAKEPQQRFGSVQAFARALEQASREHSKQAHPAFAETIPASIAATPQPGPSPVVPSRTPDLASSPQAEKAAFQQTPNLANEAAWTISIPRFRPQRFLATVIGVVLYSLLISLLQWQGYSNFFQFDEAGGITYTNQAITVLALFSLFELVPLFFGTVFGYLTGLIVGLAGFFIGTYIYFFNYTFDTDIFNYFSFLDIEQIWLSLLHTLILCIFAFRAALKTQGRYNTSGNLMTAYIWSMLGVLVAGGITISIWNGDSFAQGTFLWPLLLIYILSLSGPSLLLFALMFYASIVERIQKGKRVGAVQA